VRPECLGGRWKFCSAGRFCYAEDVVSSFDYDKAAAHYDLHRSGGGPYMPTLVRLAQEARARQILVLGAGTGNNTQAFSAAYAGYRERADERLAPVVALERSAGMMARGREKGVDARWVRADATALPLGKGSMDFIFGVCVIHHIRDLTRLFCECYRVLRDGGVVAVVTSPHDYIKNHPMNAYFPSFARIDAARFQPISEVLDALNDAGFSNGEAYRDIAAPSPIDTGYAHRVAGKYLSTFALIPPEELEAGLKRLYNDLARNGGVLDGHIAWEPVTVAGRKTQSHPTQQLELST